ncbi:MAG: beta-hydroxyacyl-ACP dehydratase [Desulfobulbaceae bacterium]|nr:beta-hydroxyacyl-ACP dehydratase [Desulfobulbaceae bacterium]
MPSSYANITASPLAGCLTDLRVDREARTGGAQLCCPPTFPGFVGHFPGAPVLPAVLQVLAVRLLAEAILGSGLAPLGVERLKFKGMVHPGEVVRVSLVLKDRAAGLGAEFALDREGAPIASGCIIFRPGGKQG